MSSDRKIRVANIPTAVKGTVIQIDVQHFDTRKAYMLSGYVAEGVGSGMIRVGLSTMKSAELEPTARFSAKRLSTLAAEVSREGDTRIAELATKIAAAAGVTIEQPAVETIEVTA